MAVVLYCLLCRYAINDDDADEITFTLFDITPSDSWDRPTQKAKVEFLRLSQKVILVISIQYGSIFVDAKNRMKLVLPGQAHRHPYRHADRDRGKEVSAHMLRRKKRRGNRWVVHIDDRATDVFAVSLVARIFRSQEVVQRAFPADCTPVCALKNVLQCRSLFIA